MLVAISCSPSCRRFCCRSISPAPPRVRKRGAGVDGTPTALMSRASAVNAPTARVVAVAPMMKRRRLTEPLRDDDMVIPSWAAHSAVGCHGPYGVVRRNDRVREEREVDERGPIAIAPLRVSRGGGRVLHDH